MQALVIPEAEDDVDTEDALAAATDAVGSLNLDAFRVLFASDEFVAGLQRTRLSRSSLLKKLCQGREKE